MGYGRNRKVGKTMKAILVVDMPNGYPIEELRVWAEISCYGETLSTYHNKELKPMPSKKVPDGNETDEIYGCYVGWNACIDEMIGEEDD